MISYSWIKDYLRTSLLPEMFARLTTNAGNGVEHTQYLQETYNKIVVGRVDSLQAHTDANKLRVAMVEVSGGELVQIVCGGVNLEEGQKVAVALVGAHVKWHGEGDLVEIKETKIRGVESFGMICAASEIGFSELPQGEHDIWDITKLTDAAPGTPLVEALDLNDVLFDIEVTTNRPDCKSIIGQAREGFAVTGDEFVWTEPKLPAGTMEAPKIDVQAVEDCPAYFAVQVSGLSAAASPWWMQKRLLLAGYNPINMLVDITNYVLHEYGHPLHAFDADKITGDIQVRFAKEGEELELLKGQELVLRASDLVIADSVGPIALAGVMGGMRAAILSTTTNVVFESAVFDPVKIRRTARAHNLQTDASLLFEKGLPGEAACPALARALELVAELFGEVPVSKPFEYLNEKPVTEKFACFFNEVRSLMGVNVPDEEIKTMLIRLGFVLSPEKNGAVEVTVPYWRRRDIENNRDFTEEVARLYGYDRIPARLSITAFTPRVADSILVFERNTKQILKGTGCTELYAMSFVGIEDLEKTGLSSSQAVLIENPLAQDAAFLRPSLWSSMLEAIAANEREVVSADLFEVAPIHTPGGSELPIQSRRLLVASYGTGAEDLFLRVKGLSDRFFKECGAVVDFDRPKHGEDVGHFHPTQVARVQDKKGLPLGYIGSVNPDILSKWGIERDVVFLDVSLETLQSVSSTHKTYESPSPFPASKRDIACVVSDRLEVAEIIGTLKSESALLGQAEVFDVYKGKGMAEGEKSVAIHLVFQSIERTLTSEEVDLEVDRLVKKLSEVHNAKIRS